MKISYIYSSLVHFVHNNSKNNSPPNTLINTGRPKSFNIQQSYLRPLK